MDKLKFGVIGVAGRGYIARNAHNPDKGNYLIAGADIDDDNLCKFTEQCPDAKVFTDYREMLKLPELEAVFICTPDYLHEEHAVAALSAGKAVYLEKPIAITVEGCDRILRTAMETGSKLYVGHNMRHVSWVLKMKEVIDSGMIGQVQAVWMRHFINYGGDAYFRDWHSERKFSNSLLLQKASHDIDVIHWLAGGYTDAVSGMGKLSVYDKCARRSPDEKPTPSWSEENWPPLEQKGMSPIIDVEDHSMIMMQLDNGVQASYQQCHYTPDDWRDYTFIGTHGRVENYTHRGECHVIVYNNRMKFEIGPDIHYRLKPLSGSHGGADPLILDEFCQFIKHGIATNTSPVAARMSVAVGCCGVESIRSDGGRKQIPALSKDIIEYFENGQKK